MEDLECADELIRAHLPPAIAEMLDSALPEAVDAQHVSATLRRSRSDRIFRFRLKRGCKRKFLYVIAEFQSTVDPGLVWRTQSYATQLAKREAADDTPSGRRKRACVIALIFYHGRKKWNVAVSLADDVEADEELVPYLLDYRCSLRDLGRMAVEKLATGAKLQAVLRAAVHACRKSVTGGEIEALLRLVPEESDFADPLLLYIMGAMPADSSVIKRAVKNAWPKTGVEKMGPMGRELVDAGRKEERVNMLEGLLTRRFGSVPSQLRKVIRKGSAAEHNQLLDAIVDGHTLDDLCASCAAGR